MVIKTGNNLKMIKGRPFSFLLKKSAHELIRQIRRSMHKIGVSSYKSESLVKTYFSADDLSGYLIGRKIFNFFFTAGERELIAERYAELFPAEKDEVIKKADMVCSNTFDLLGSGPVCLGHDIDWNTDFKTGMKWPPKYYLDHDFRDMDRPSDVKVPWELSRLQFLSDLGRAFTYTKDKRYVVKYKEIIRDWDEKNPAGETINWACSMEVALRAVSMIWALHFFLGSEELDRDFLSRYIRMLVEHGKFIYRNMEFSDINSNHHISNLVGLIYLGLFLGEIPESQRWINTALRSLQREVLLETYPDGVSHEGSIPYHRFVTEMFITAVLLCERNKVPIRSSVWSRIEKMTEFIIFYLRPDGNAPVMGDADNGRVHDLGTQDINDHRYLLSTGAVLFDREDMKGVSGRYWEESAWMLGLEGWEKYDNLSSSGERVSRAFEQGGFFVMAHNDDHVIIDCGDIGLRGRGGHGHNDLLSFEFCTGGDLLFMDLGCYTYTSSKRWLKYFKSSFAHNVAVVDGEEQSVMEERFVPTPGPCGHNALKWQADGEKTFFSGECFGYHRLGKPVTWIRSLLLDKKGTLTIKDRFTGEGEHAFSFLFNLHPKWAPTFDGSRIMLENSTNKKKMILQASDDSMRAKFIRVMYAPSYGVREETTQIVFRKEAEIPFEATFYIKPEGI